MHSSKVNMLRRVAAGAVLTCSLIWLAGCTPPDTSVSGTTSVNTQTGATTVSATVTLTWKHQPLQHFTLWMAPLSGSDLASLDTSQSILNLSLSNATIASTSGAVTISVTDDTTGAIVGQQAFGYVVNGNGLFAQDPAAVSNWLQQFTSYSSVDVNVAATTNLQAINPGTASVTSNAVYQGVNYVSSTASWTARPVGGSGGCHTSRCPNQ